MKVDDILARKRKLAEQRKTAEGFEAELLDEEIRDLNAQLRSLRGGTRSQGQTSSRLLMDRAVYDDWRVSERDEEMHQAHQVYYDALKNSDITLTPRQRELFALWQSGVSVTELAERFDVDKSTVSRTITRCKTHMREEAERLGKVLRLGGMTVLDLADRDVAKVVLSCLTAKQAVCIYLYYGEWLNLRECGELLGVDHTAVLRSVQRGLRAIQDTLACESFTLDNADALSDLAYELYMQYGGPSGEQTPEARKGGSWARRKLGYRPTHKTYRPSADCTVRTSDGLVSRGGTAHRSFLRPMSKLLTLLYTLRERGGLREWLHALFLPLIKKGGHKAHVHKQVDD